MSGNHYIELDSTYRDRTRFTNPAQFEVLISQTGVRNAVNAIDPVSLSAPKITFNNVLDQIGSATSITGVISAVTTSTVGAAGSRQEVYVTFTVAANNPIETQDYYKGLMLQDTTVSPVEERRITSSTYIGLSGGTDIMKFEVDRAFGDGALVGDTILINSPTDVTTDTSNPQIFVPTAGDAENGYAGCFLFNETQNESRPISGFDATTHILSLTATGTATTTSGIVTGWANNDIYSIRKILPSEVAAYTAFATTTTVTLAATASLVDDFYNGRFLRITQVSTGAEPSTRTAPFYEIRRIVDYDGATQTVTVAPGFTTTGAVAANNNYEILPFSYDNAVPLNYTGSTVSHQEMVCYEIELLHLILPNKTLAVDRGNRITFYPYVYVEFQNMSASSAGTNGVIYSNNPNSTRMLFKASVDDVPSTTNSPFVKIDGDGMRQTVKFKPNDALKFGVYLPDGTLFQTVDVDTSSPFEPDALIQISALFSIRRLV